MAASYCAVRRKASNGQAVAGLRSHRALRAPELVEHRHVLAGVGDDDDAVMVLGGASDHARATDIDVLDGLLEGDARPGDGLLERVERHRHEVDGTDAVGLERRHVLRPLAAREDAPVDLRVERLHPPVEHLGKARDLGDVHHGHA
jgi:hypothetical protein